MKKIKFIIFSLITLLTFSCSDDFLNYVDQNKISADVFYKSTTQLRQATAPLYNIVWHSYNEKAAMSIGDALGGNVECPWQTQINTYARFKITSLDPFLAEAWNSFFRVVNQSNLFIRNVKTNASSDISAKDLQAAIAEAKFMRATAYFDLVQVWGPVPIIENPDSVVKVVKVPLNKVEDVYKFIINDYKYAIANLPLTDVPGRVTQWSAKGMLSKVYLTYAGYNRPDGVKNQAMLDSAKVYAADVCKNSGLELYPDYAKLFMTQYENSSESLFALQWVYTPSGGGDASNAWQAYYAYSAAVTGVGDGWGGAVRASLDLMYEYEKDPIDTLRRNASVFVEGAYYPEIGRNKGGTYYASTSPAIKKYVIGSPEDNNGQVAIMSTGINSYILRLADVYLIYAEAILGNNLETTNADALLYLNKVRARAKVDPITSITPEKIRHERRVEFAFEQQAGYDLIRWAQSNNEATIQQYLISQNRARGYGWYRELQNGSHFVLGGLWETSVDPSANIRRQDVIKLPYPEGDRIQNPYFDLEPVSYNFND